MSEAPSVASTPSVPQHVAIIMDGNGRWAKARGLPRNIGHRQGAENVSRIVKTAINAGVKYLTLFAFSAENWNRPESEISALMKLLKRFLRSQEKELIKMDVQLRTIGDITALPADVQEQIRSTTAKCSANSRGVLILALNYGSRQEIVTAAQTLARKVAKGTLAPDSITWDTLSGDLYTADIPDPDLIIRTSGEMRISNFLLLQSAYSEFYFSDKNWPEFGARDFHDALDNFAHRQRRFGQTGEQIEAMKQGHDGKANTK